MAIAAVENIGATKRDYSLVGASTRAAIETGSASAEWYHTDVPRKVMKELMQRSDGPAIRDTMIWMGAAAAARRPAESISGAPGVASRSSSSTARSTARRATPAGTNAVTAPRSRHSG